jgi:hypothetical protein
MIELKVKDPDSLGKLVEALTRNGYKVATFVVWKNGKIGDIDYFTVEVRQ